MPALPKRSFSQGDKTLYCVTEQVRQWVNMWHSHLGVKATPKNLVEVITKKVGGATMLKDKIKKEFQLE